LPKLADDLEGVEPFTAPNVETALRASAEKSAVKAGLFINASRTMLTGQSVGHQCLRCLKSSVVSVR